MKRTKMATTIAASKSADSETAFGLVHALPNDPYATPWDDTPRDWGRGHGPLRAIRKTFFREKFLGTWSVVIAALIAVCGASSRVLRVSYPPLQRTENLAARVIPQIHNSLKFGEIYAIKNARLRQGYDQQQQRPDERSLPRDNGISPDSLKQPTTTAWKNGERHFRNRTF